LRVGFLGEGEREKEKNKRLFKVMTFSLSLSNQTPIIPISARLARNRVSLSPQMPVL